MITGITHWSCDRNNYCLVYCQNWTEYFLWIHWTL